MAEGDVRLFGSDTGVSKKQFPWLLGGAAIVTVLALRSRPSPSASGPTLDQGLAAAQATNAANSVEFARIQQEAASELAQLSAANKLESQSLEYNYELAKANTPGAQRMCISLREWYALPTGTHKSFENRVANGQLIETIGPNGICFTPTAAGLTGYMPYTRTRSKSGLFGGSYEVTGPANATAGSNPMAPPPSLFSFLESILRALNQPILS